MVYMGGVNGVYGGINLINDVYGRKQLTLSNPVSPLTSKIVWHYKVK